MNHKTISFAEKFTTLTELWSPKIIAQMNDYDFKIAKIHGEFVWHKHDETDETFIVIDGQMRIEFRDGAAHLQAGEMIVVPKRVEHKPVADEVCHILLIEPAGTVNTGNAGGEMTVENTEWI